MPTMPTSITIWIHGTRMFSRPFFPSFFSCPEGLNCILQIDPSYHHRQLSELMCTADPQRFNPETFYLFGWSGYLSFNARELAAAQLYEALKKIVTEYKQKYCMAPFIRIITHSHGGNVALNLSKFIVPADEFIVDELILMACPVQECTKNFVTAPIFKKIYSLYSLMDSIQVADPQLLYKETRQYPNSEKKPFFSERLFPHYPHITQARIRKGNRGIMHIEYILSNFATQLPRILDTLDRLTCDNKTTNTQSIIVNLKQL